MNEPLKRTGRDAILQALSEELGHGLDDETVRAADRILARLWLHGFKIAPLTPEDEKCPTPRPLI